MFSPPITDVEAYHQLHKDFSLQPTHDPTRVRYVGDQCFVMFDEKWLPASSVWVYLSISEPSMNLCSHNCQTEAPPTKKKGRPVRLCSITEQNGWARVPRNGKVSLHHLHFGGCQVRIALRGRGRGGGGKAIPLTAPRG